MSVKDKIQQHGIYYAFGRYDVQMDGDKTLDKLASLMKENPDIKVQLTGHCDAEEVCNPAEKIVSLRRAEYVSVLMEQKGVSADRCVIEHAKSLNPSPYVRESHD